MIRPTLDLLASCTLKWDGRIFLLGYSSGGYGALAAVKEWHLNPRYADLPLTAAACMAGPFHFSESTRAFLTEAAPCQRPDIQARLLRAYHDLYPESGVFAPERAMNDELLEERGDGLDPAQPARLTGDCFASAPEGRGPTPAWAAGFKRRFPPGARACAVLPDRRPPVSGTAPVQRRIRSAGARSGLPP